METVNVVDETEHKKVMIEAVEATQPKKTKKWKKVNVKEKDIFDGSTLDGFLGLEELTDYDSNQLAEILTETKRRKRKIVDISDIEKDSIAKSPSKDVKTESLSVANVEKPKNSKDGPKLKKRSKKASDNSSKKTNNKGKKVENTEDPISQNDNTENITSQSNSTENLKSQNDNIILPLTSETSNENKQPTSEDISDKSSTEKVDSSSITLTKSQKKRELLKQKQKKKKLLKLKEKMKARKLELTPLNPSLDNKKSNIQEETPSQTSDKKNDNTKSNETVPVKSPDMSDWNGLDVPETILKALAEMNFTNPTPIQSKALPAAMAHRQDVIGAAETGSGKTLAFGIPLIKIIADMKEAQSKKEQTEDDSPLYALVLTPTRELALQVDKHIRSAAKHTSIKCVAIVGGMAAVKQERLLKRCPEIVVGTPGRLHQLINDGDEHLSKFSSLKFLVLDECDRMLEFGHFKEVNEILHIINQNTTKRQNFVFSATLTLPQYHKDAKRRKVLDKDDQLQQLLDKVGLNKKAKVIDLTTKHVTATKLEQRKVTCTNEDKDLYLHYFLITHPGRTMVFVNSISLTKKLFALFTLLGKPPLQLHAGKQQRQRLKCLERFAEQEDGLLITTDVAARGLDIPEVQYVVHYQLPSDPKIYIHRAGRTARAQKAGLSVILEGPEDFFSYKNIAKVLKLDEDIPSLDVEPSFYDEIKKRVSLAKSIEKEEFKERKANANKNWTKKLSSAMDIEYDEDNENEPVLTKKEKQRISAMKQELNRLLKTEIYPKGFSGSYPTRTGLLKLPGLPAI